MEALGAQLVSPEFHQTSADSSLFGSQHSSQEDQPGPHPHDQSESRTFPPSSPSTTVRNHSGVLSGTDVRNIRDQDRKHWKNLRDFVDDQAIEDILETIEGNRTALDVGDGFIWNWHNIELTVRTYSGEQVIIPRPSTRP